MAEEQKTNGGIAHLVFWLGAAASCIGIFVFLTGIENIQQLLGFTSNTHPDHVEIGDGIQANTPKGVQTANTPTPDVPSLVGVPRFLGLADEIFSGIFVDEDSTIVVSTTDRDHGVFRSDNGGETWRAVNNGLGNFDVVRFHVAPGNINSMIAITYSGIWVTHNGGSSWFLLGNDQDVSVGTFISADGQKIMGMHQYYETYVSDDGGQSWRIVNEDFASCTGNMRASQADYSYIYCTSGNHWNVYSAMFATHDGGMTWFEPAGIGDRYDAISVSPSPHDPRIVFVGTPYNGAYKTLDGGYSWIPINSMLPDQGLDLSAISIAESPIVRNLLLLGTEGYGLFISTNQGDTWSLLADVEGEISWIAFHPVMSDRAYIAVDESGVFEVQLPN